MSVADVPAEYLASRKEYIATKLAPVLAVLSHEVVDKWPEDARAQLLSRLCSWRSVATRFERAEAQQTALLKQLEALRGPRDASSTPRGAKRFNTMAPGTASVVEEQAKATPRGKRAVTEAAKGPRVGAAQGEPLGPQESRRKSRVPDQTYAALVDEEQPRDRRIEVQHGVENMKGEIHADDEDVVYGPADPAEVAALRRAAPYLVSEAQQRRVLARGERCTVQPRVRVLQEGDAPQRGYLVLSGTLLAFEGGKCVASIRKGGYFGGVWPLPSLPLEPVSVESVDECCLVAATAEQLLTARVSQQREDEEAARAEDMADHVPFYPKSMEQELRIRTLLKTCPFFRGIPEDIMTQVQGAFRELHVAPRTVVFKQDAAPDFFYLVESGTVVFLRAEGGRSECIGTATGTGYFGELGVLRGDGRCAGAESADDTVLWKLEKHVFGNILLDFVQNRRDLGLKVLNASAANVPAVAELLEYERALVADLLVPKALADGEEMSVAAGELLFVAGGEVEGPLGEWAWGQEYKVGDVLGDARGLESEPEAVPVKVRGVSEAEACILDMAAARRVLGREN